MKNKKIVILLLCLFLTGCSEKTYTVSFDTSGGTNINSIILKEGETIKGVIPPTRDGYLFVNWLKDGIEYNDETPITNDITLTANWTIKPSIPKTYTVTIIADEKTEKIVVKENEIIKEPNIVKKENYKFLGWYVENQKYDFNNKITSDITITAKYEYNFVTITYELDGGEGLKVKKIRRNTTVPIPELPVKDGYRFLKWTLNDEDFSFTTKIKKNITLKANWEKIEYVTLNFDTDGGNKIEPKTIEKYSKIGELPTPIKEGYKFIEWYINDKKIETDITIESNVILKAIYEEIVNE